MISWIPVNNVKSLFARKLINSRETLDDVYEWLMCHFNNEYQLGKIQLKPPVKIDIHSLDSSFELLKKKAVRSVGIDFPVHLSKGKERSVMMVCAMDPLRSDSKDKLASNDISYWVPFSIINNPSRQTKYSEKENLAFFHTLLETYDLYLTDIFKLFYREGNAVSNTQKEYRRLPVHKEILEAEISMIKPSVILTLGNNARDALCDILNLNPPSWSDTICKTNFTDQLTLVMVPHISGAANGSKSPILNNQRYKDINGNNNEKYANIILKELKTDEYVRI